MTLLENIWAVTAELGGWFLVGLFVAALMHVLVPKSLFRRWLGKSSLGNIAKAAFIGVPMPLCSCGVVPAVIAMKKKGASNSACLSFLISTPQTGIDSLLVSASFLSWPFAIFKFASAFIIGLSGGFSYHIFHKSETESGIEDFPEEEKSSNKSRIKEMYDFAVNELFYNLWKWMVGGILLAAVISTYVSSDTLGATFFADPLYGSLAALFLSIPLYVCATSSVPIAAVLIMKGLHPAAALVFLIAGPATNTATIGLIYKSFGRLFTAIYLIAVSIGSVLSAILFSSVITLQLQDGYHHHHHGSENWFTLAGGIIFSLLLLSFTWRDIRSFIKSRLSRKTDSIALKVEGMNCQSCVGKIRKNLIEKGLADTVSGEPQQDSLIVSGKPLQRHKIESALKDLGFIVPRAL